MRTLAAFFSLVAVSHAAMIKVPLTAEVSRVLDVKGVLGGSIQPGMLITGEYTYDDDVPPQSGLIARYDQLIPYSLTVGSWILTGKYEIVVTNDLQWGDSYGIQTINGGTQLTNGVVTQGFPLASNWTLTSGGNPYSSPSLPTPPDVSTGEWISGGMTFARSYSMEENKLLLQIDAQLLSLNGMEFHTVPEPSGLAIAMLVFCSIVGLVGGCYLRGVWEGAKNYKDKS